MNFNFPLVSVVMPVYNCDLYIKDAIDSILNQTLTDFELLIIDDFSSDNTKKCIEKIADKRIIFFKNSENKGQCWSMNFAIEKAKSNYIAIMHGDDISLPNRLKFQFDFMEANKEYGLCGGWFKYMDQDEIMKPLSGFQQLKIGMLDGPHFIHSSVMLRKDIIIENNLFYNEEFRVSEDYDLWSRFLKVTKLETIPEVLVEYRIHENQLSKRGDEQIKASIRIQKNLLSWLYSNDDFCYPFFNFYDVGSINYLSHSCLLERLSTIDKLCFLNRQKKIFLEDLFHLYAEVQRTKTIKYFFTDRRSPGFYNLFHLFKKLRLYYKYLGLNRILKFTIKTAILYRYWMKK